MGIFGPKTAKNPPLYNFRQFETTDARQFAFDDYAMILTSQGGLAGLRPLWNVSAAQVPNGFDYVTNLNGLGGTPSPQHYSQPLIYQPDIATQFLEENS